MTFKGKKIEQNMNSKTSVRFSVAAETRARSVFRPQFSQAIYTRCATSQPGYYIIRLRLHQARNQFRPRLRFL